MELAGILPKLRAVQRSTLDLHEVPLHTFPFDQFDRIRDVYAKYFQAQETYLYSIGDKIRLEELGGAQARVEMMFANAKIGELGCKMEPVFDLKG